MVGCRDGEIERSEDLVVRLYKLLMAENIFTTMCLCIVFVSLRILRNC